MTSPTRVLFLEVDAGDKVLIQRWAADGTLPTFRELLARGAVGDTLAPPGLFVGGIWPSLYTGVSPARHGVHSLVQLVPGTYEFRRFATGELVKREQTALGGWSRTDAARWPPAVPPPWSIQASPRS